PSPSSRALQLRELQENASLEQVLRSIALQLRLEHVFWTHDEAGAQLQARFDLRQDERYERLLCTLQDWGIGERPGTHVTAINCLETRVKLTSTGSVGSLGSAASTAWPGARRAAAGNAARSGAGGSAGAGAGAGAADAVDAASQQSGAEGHRLGWQSFMDSVRCRLNVNQVVRVVRRDATINFDFVVLLMAAALLSCVGLVENSFLFLSSSMLISPLMGPIIAGIFGSVIGDRGLRWLGIRNELIGLGISVLTGFIFGAAICLCGLGRFFVLADGFTEEIISRCDTHSLVIGVCTALASGAAAAIGVLGGNTGSLVGVAISASLLPPAVNAGLLWAIALCTQLLHVDPQLVESLAKRHEYSQQLHVELFVCATVSMALTLLNVVCVWLMGVVVLRIKEVAPAVQRDQKFWRHDVRLAREVALHDPELHSAIDRLDLHERRQVNVDAPHYQHTWSPGTAQTQAGGLGKQPHAVAGSSSGSSSNYHTVHGFRDFCITLHQLNSELPRPASVPLPSFMDVFKPPAEHTGQTAQAGATAVCSTSATGYALAASPTNPASVANYRSLPDLRAPEELSLALPPPPAAPVESGMSKAKLPRCVHWREECEETASSTTLQQTTLQETTAPECVVQSPRSSGQVLLPLPPDRRLQLLLSREKGQVAEDDDEDEEGDEHAHEFHV
ncbi:hypothetical protein KR222_005258, partial [Zaprionus bogoriensis]